MADGTLLLRDPTAQQQQDVAALSRDMQQANGSISPIFDKAREQKRLQTISLVGDIAGQAADIARTQGEINALKEARKANPDMPLDKLKETKKYKEEQAKYGTGSDIQRGIQAATAALQGLAGGDIGAALAGASAPELAHLLKSTEGNTAVNALAHAILGGAVAALQGNSVAAGATGAAAGELAARAITGMLYPGVDDLTTLSEEQKQTISMLSTISAGIAGGLAGDSTAAAATGAQAGKTAVENNYLHVDEALAFDKEMQSCRAAGGDCSSVIEKYQKISDDRSAELDAKCAADPVMCQGWDKELAYGGIQAVERPEWMGDIFGLDVMRNDEAKAYVQYWNSVDLAKIDTSSADWAKFATFISDPENQAALVSAGLLSKDIIKLATATASNIRQGGVLASIKSMQIGLRNPQQVDQIKKDMLSGDYKFTAPEGRIAGYIDNKGTYYISEGNHRMVAAQEIYKKTGDASYIDNLLKNGVWTQTKNAPAGAKPMPKR